MNRSFRRGVCEDKDMPCENDEVFGKVFTS